MHAHASKQRTVLDGNRYFRELIQQNVGSYLGARTKLEKGEAIALIVDKIKQKSPQGGLIKKNVVTGRWYRIRDSEARDKVGHAIRKAVQRLEETKPKLAARLKQEGGYASRRAEATRRTRSNRQRSPTAGAPMSSGHTLSIEKGREDEEEGGGTFPRRSSPQIAATMMAPANTGDDGKGNSLSTVVGGRRRGTWISASTMNNQAVNQDATKVTSSRIFHHIIGSDPTGGGLVGSTSNDIAPAGATPPLALLGLPTAVAGPLSAGPNGSGFPRQNNPALLNSARLAGGLVFGQTAISYRLNSMAHGYSQLLGFNPNPVRPANKLWLTAAAMRHHQEAQRAKELTYARRLALTALRDLPYPSSSASEHHEREPQDDERSPLNNRYSKY